jgi:hypothetical protein
MRQNFAPGGTGSVVNGAAVVLGAVVNWAFVIGHCGCRQSCAWTAPSRGFNYYSPFLGQSYYGLGAIHPYKLLLSTMLSFYNMIYTSSPINSASSLSSSSVRSRSTSV